MVSNMSTARSAVDDQTCQNVATALTTFTKFVDPDKEALIQACIDVLQNPDPTLEWIVDTIPGAHEQSFAIQTLAYRKGEKFYDCLTPAEYWYGVLSGGIQHG